MVFWDTCLATGIRDIIEATEATTEAGAAAATVEASAGREEHGPGDRGAHQHPQGRELLRVLEAPGEDKITNTCDLFISNSFVMCKVTFFRLTKDRINEVKFYHFLFH